MADRIITTVIFDMDDTLYDEVDYCRSGFGAVAEYLAGADDIAVGADAIFSSFWGEFSSGNHKSTFNTGLDKLNIAYKAELIGELVKVYREHEPCIELPGETKSVLEMLKPKYTMALLTDGFLPAQRLKVDALGIESYFARIVYTEEIGREFWKPSPKGFEMILDDLNVEAQNCVYIADNAVKDFIAPNQLGMATIQLCRGNKIHNSPPATPIASADHITADIVEVPKMLQKMS